MKEEPQKVAALYARVSTLDQNCEVQLEDLRRHASKRFARYSEYTDAGVSGTQRHRPQGTAFPCAVLPQLEMEKAFIR